MRYAIVSKKADKKWRFQLRYIRTVIISCLIYQVKYHPKIVNSKKYKSPKPPNIISQRLRGERGKMRMTPLEK